MNCHSGRMKSTTIYLKTKATSSAPIRASNMPSFIYWKPFDAVTASFMAFFVFKIFLLRECGFEPQLNTVLKRKHFMVSTVQYNSIQWCPVQTTLQYCSVVCRHEFPTSSYRCHFLVFHIGMWYKTSLLFDLSDSHDLSRKPEIAVLL